MSTRDADRSLAERAAQIGVALDARQLEQLERYEHLLRDRALPLGLVAEADGARLQERHVLDCLRAAALVEESDRLAYDLGSGAGLPGVVVAIARPQVHVRLVEAQRRRAAFLELVVETLAAPNLSVEAGRAETTREPADVCFARALAPLEQAWRLAYPRLRDGGRLVYFAGEGWRRPAAPLSGASHMSASVRSESLLESCGPLIIMTR